MEESGEKTQDATPHRRQQAREEGQIVQSQDLAAAIILLAGLLLVLTLGGRLVEFFGNFAHRQLGEAWLSADGDFIAEQTHTIIGELAKASLPILAALLAIAIGSHLVQFGFLFLPEKLLPDFSRINPLSGFSRLFSLQNFVRLGFGIVKILIVATVAFWSLYNRRIEILSVASMELPKIASFLTSIVLWTSLKIAGAYLSWPCSTISSNGGSTSRI